MIYVIITGMLMLFNLFAWSTTGFASIVGAFGFFVTLGSFLVCSVICLNNRTKG